MRSIVKTVFIFGMLIMALLTLFQLSTYSISTGRIQIEWVIAIIAVVFFGIGFIINRKNKGSKGFSTTEGTINETKIADLGITEREYEILIKISEGLSNKEIGERLFISESTVKTHLSNLYSKLDAKRRTQAIQKAKQLEIITT
jgi:DNA-binding NarL/FixJ family response regulator